MATNQGSIFTGTKIRTRQSPLYDSFSVAATTALSATGTIKMFGNVQGVGGVGPDTTNMQQAFSLQGGESFLVRSMRCIFHTTTAADITAFMRQFTVRLIAGGITLLDAPADYWPGGAGVATAASNGIPDPRAIVGFDLDPILLTDGINFRTELVGTSFTTTTAFFMRVYLDGQKTEPV